jgi:rare lipoprotein A
MMPRYRLVAAAVAILLAGCGSESVRDGSTQARVARRPPESTTPAAAAAAGVSTANSGRGKSASTWQGTPLPTRWPDQDGPPHESEVPAEIAAIPDAVPQFETRSEFGNPDSYEVYGKKYVVLDDATGFRERGRASWYGKKFHGKKTSSGEPYDMFSMTGAHKTLPIPCYARITNLDTGHSVIIKINDRGPFHDGRIVDVSYAAAVKLDMLGHGSIPVQLEVVTPVGRPSPSMLAAAAPSTAGTAMPQMSAEPGSSTAPMPVTTAAATAAVPQPANPAGVVRFLQAGLFTDPVNAAGLRDRLGGLGITNTILRSEERNGGYAYRVLIGPFGDAAALESTRSRMLAANLPSVTVSE